MTLLHVLFGILVWYILGILVLAWIDKDGRLFNWASTAPILWFFHGVILLWPVVVWAYYRDEN